MSRPAPAALLDTDWVIHYLQDREPYAGRIEGLGLSRVGISAPTAAEIYEGVFFSRDPDGSRRRLREFLGEGILVLPMTHEIAVQVGRERGRLRQTGMAIGDFDLVIGCTARHSGIPLCTENRRHFERIEGLEVISVDS